MSAASVGLVIVSHSAKIAEGVVELAAQMATTTRLIAAGGTDDGRIGTSFDRVQAAITEADGGGGVVVLCDLGSAILTAETALDFLDDDLRGRVRIAAAPIVEGAVAAAVAAETGGDLGTVLAAAESAGDAQGAGPAPHADPTDLSASPESAEAPTTATTATLVNASPALAPISATATLVNKDGLHARPAAELVKLASGFDARVTVNGVDAKSLLRIMSLGLASGDEVTLSAEGPVAREAVDALVALIESGFGE